MKSLQALAGGFGSDLLTFGIERIFPLEVQQLLSCAIMLC